MHVHYPCSKFLNSEVAPRLESKQNLHDSFLYRSPCALCIPRRKDVPSRHPYGTEMCKWRNYRSVYGSFYFTLLTLKLSKSGNYYMFMISLCFGLDKAQYEIISYWWHHTVIFLIINMISRPSVFVCIYMHDHSVHRIPWWKMHLFNEKNPTTCLQTNLDI